MTDIVGDWGFLRITASGRSALLGSAVIECGFDGHPNLPLSPDRLLVADAAPGVLLGKFGGSAAGRKDGTIFVIGSQCFVAMPGKKTQLYLGINGATPDAGNVVNDFKIEIFAVAADPT